MFHMFFVEAATVGRQILWRVAKMRTDRTLGPWQKWMIRQSMGAKLTACQFIWSSVPCGRTAMAVMALLCPEVMRKRTELSMSQKFGWRQKELCRLKQLCDALCVSWNAVYAGYFWTNFHENHQKAFKKAVNRCRCVIRFLFLFFHHVQELQGHSDDASVAELSPSIMRREVGSPGRKPKLCKSPAVLVFLYQRTGPKPFAFVEHKGGKMGQVLQLHDAKLVRRYCSCSKSRCRFLFGNRGHVGKLKKKEDAAHKPECSHVKHLSETS